MDKSLELLLQLYGEVLFLISIFLKVAAKDSMNLGDRICLPITVKEFPDDKQEEGHCSEEEINFIRSLVLHKVHNC